MNFVVICLTTGSLSRVCLLVSLVKVHSVSLHWATPRKAAAIVTFLGSHSCPRNRQAMDPLTASITVRLLSSLKSRIWPLVASFRGLSSYWLHAAPESCLSAWPAPCGCALAARLQKRTEISKLTALPAVIQPSSGVARSLWLEF